MSVDHLPEFDSIARDTLRTLADHVDTGGLVQLHADGSATVRKPLMDVLLAACNVARTADHLTFVNVEAELQGFTDAGEGAG